MRISGFYAVLDRDDEVLARTLVGPGGARILQVRMKTAKIAEVVRVARMARRVCSEHGAALVINDRLDVALAVEADAVHLGQTDLPIEHARRIVGLGCAIGVSTHNIAQFTRAWSAHTDYIAFGPIFATSTKVDPDPVLGLHRLRAAVAAAGGRPVVAIGGITPERAAEVYTTGVAAICAIGAVNNAPDVAAAARAMGRISP